MDPITSAIVLGVAGNFATDAVKAAYKALKDALTNKYSSDSKLVKAVNELEQNPNSKARKATVQEEVESAKALDDSEIVQLAQQLLAKVKEQPGGEQVITQTINNVKYAATSATGDASISNINEHGKSKQN